MAFYEDKTEINIENGNPPVARSRRFALKNYTGESGKVDSAVPVSSEPGAAARVKNLTDERDALQRNLNNLTFKLNSLTEERDELKSQLDIYALYSQEGWLFFKSSFYNVSSTKNTWQASREACLQHGADLVVINTREEQEFIVQFQKIAWIGLTDIETEGEWKWVDGTPLTTSFWFAREPNSYLSKNEDCVETRFGKRESWNDEICESKNFWICEKNITQHAHHPVN